MAKVVFPKVELKGTRLSTCTLCKKLARKTIHVWQTLSPFNTNKAGQRKTENEVYAELRAELAELGKKPMVCRACERKKVSPCQS